MSKKRKRNETEDLNFAFYNRRCLHTASVWCNCCQQIKRVESLYPIPTSLPEWLPPYPKIPKKIPPYRFIDTISYGVEYINLVETYKKPFLWLQKAFAPLIANKEVSLLDKQMFRYNPMTHQEDMLIDRMFYYSIQKLWKIFRWDQTFLECHIDETGSDSCMSRLPMIKFDDVQKVCSEWYLIEFYPIQSSLKVIKAYMTVELECSQVFTQPDVAKLINSYVSFNKYERFEIVKQWHELFSQTWILSWNGGTWYWNPMEFINENDFMDLVCSLQSSMLFTNERSTFGNLFNVSGTLANKQIEDEKFHYYNPETQIIYFS